VDSYVQKVRRRRTSIEGTTFNFSCVTDFESLALSAHHYVDILNSFAQKSIAIVYEHDSSESQQNVVKYKSEVFDLRRQIFKYTTDNTEAVRTALVRWDSELGELDLLHRSSNSDLESKNATEDFVAIGNRRSRIRSKMVEEFLVMLKISAEAGNDLFGVSSTYEDKVMVANSVFKTLSVSPC